MYYCVQVSAMCNTFQVNYEPQSRMKHCVQHLKTGQQSIHRQNATIIHHRLNGGSDMTLSHSERKGMLIAKEKNLLFLISFQVFL